MSDEISVGDFRTNQDGTEFEVIAIDGRFLWAKWEDAMPPMTQTLDWVKRYTTPKPNFFEEGATYSHSESGNVSTVDHVFERDGKMFAVVQSLLGGSYYVFSQNRWDQGYYKKV